MAKIKDTGFPENSIRSLDPVREVTAQELGLTDKYEKTSQLSCEIEDDDEILLKVSALLSDGYAGVILTGPPGTSKTWYAKNIASKLVSRDPRRVRFLQFHPSYQYEDFVEGYVPDVEGGFILSSKHLLEMCEITQ